MSGAAQLFLGGGPSKVGSVQVLNSGQYYSINSGVNFSGGGGTGAAATANTYVNGSYGTNTWGFSYTRGPYLFGLDCTSLPTGFTISPNPVNNWQTPPTVSYSYFNCLEMDGNATATKNGTGVADGTYTLPMYGFDSGLENGSITITLVNSVVTSTVINSRGLATYDNYYFYTFIGSAPNSVWINIPQRASARKGVAISISGGVISTGSGESFTPVGGTYTPWSTQTFNLSLDQLTYTYNLYGVSSVTVTNPGQNYYAAPTATISGSVYSGAASLQARLV
jgi:hypothetical protein